MRESDTAYITNRAQNRQASPRSRPGERHCIAALERREICCPPQRRMTPRLVIGKQRRQQLSGMPMARPHAAKLTDHRAACEIKIAKSVEELVANEFVIIPQA